MLRLLIRLYESVESPDWVSICQCLMFLDDAAEVAKILERLLKGSEVRSRASVLCKLAGRAGRTRALLCRAQRRTCVRQRASCLPQSGLCLVLACHYIQAWRRDLELLLLRPILCRGSC